MIDEKKLIDDLLHNDGMEFEVILSDFTPEAIANAFQEFSNKMKEGIVALIKAQPSFGWISVNELLPPPFLSVLVQMPGEKPFPTVREGFISNDGIWHSALYDREPGEVTHWRMMPEPPKDGEP